MADIVAFQKGAFRLDLAADQAKENVIVAVEDRHESSAGHGFT
jgi:hypothetical protein